MLSGAGNILPMAMRFFRDDGHFLLCVCMYVGVCVLYIYVGGGVHEQQLEEDGGRPALSLLASIP